MEFFINSTGIHQMVKNFYPEMILRPLFCFEDTKNTVRFINI